MRRRFARVYNARSRFLHGSSSPFDPKFLKTIIDAEDLSRAVIWRAMSFFDRDGSLLDFSLTDKDLGVAYDALVDWSNSPIE